MRFTAQDIGDGGAVASRVRLHEAWMLFPVRYGGAAPGAVLVLHEAIARVIDRPDDLRAGIAGALNAIAENRSDAEMIRGLTSDEARWSSSGSRGDASASATLAPPR